ncbi:hypothetical protein ACFLQN_00980, partial [Candidatus Aenigmatarchaeota archaeon]
MPQGNHQQKTFMIITECPYRGTCLDVARNVGFGNYLEGGNCPVYNKIVSHLNNWGDADYLPPIEEEVDLDDFRSYRQSFSSNQGHQRRIRFTVILNKELYRWESRRTKNPKRP